MKRLKMEETTETVQRRILEDGEDTDQRADDMEIFGNLEENVNSSTIKAPKKMKLTRE